MLGSGYKVHRGNFIGLRGRFVLDDPHGARGQGRGDALLDLAQFVAVRWRCS